MEQTAKHFRKRDAILSCLRQTTEHPSAEWIHSKLKESHSDISLGTVYRNLSLFKDQGVIASLGTVKGVERFDGNTEPHVHFICSQCGRILDLHQMRIPQELSDAASRYSGGCAATCQLSFYGSCRECMQIKKEETP